MTEIKITYEMVESALAAWYKAGGSPERMHDALKAAAPLIVAQAVADERHLANMEENLKRINILRDSAAVRASKEGSV